MGSGGGIKTQRSGKKSCTHMHAHTCMHTRMHARMHTHTHTHTHTHLPGCVHAHCLAVVSMNSNTHFCKGTLTAEIKRSEVKLLATCIHTYIYLRHTSYIHTYIHTYVHIYSIYIHTVYIYIHTYIHTVCTYIHITVYKSHLPFFLYCLCLLQFVFPRFVELVHQLLCFLR